MPEAARKSKVPQNPYTKVGLVIGGILTALSMSGTSLFHALDDSDEERVERKTDKTYELLKQKVEFEAQKTSYLYHQLQGVQHSMQAMRAALDMIALGSNASLPEPVVEENPFKPVRAARGVGGGGGSGSGYGMGAGALYGIAVSADDPLAGVDEEALAEEEGSAEGLDLDDVLAAIEPPQASSKEPDPEEELPELKSPEELFAPQAQQQLPEDLDDAL